MLILVGPSASGKTQILQVLIKEYGLKKLVTYTTRKMRINEVEGVDYHFITREDFEEKIKSDFFFEYVIYNNNYYGTSKNDFGKEKAVILEPSGLRKYIKKVRDQITIVVLKCSKPILAIRMANRGDRPSSIKERLDSDLKIFNSELFQIADKVVDTSSSNIYNDASIINAFYQKEIGGK